MERCGTKFFWLVPSLNGRITVERGCVEDQQQEGGQPDDVPSDMGRIELSRLLRLAFSTVALRLRTTQRSVEKRPGRQFGCGVISVGMNTPTW